MKHLIGKKDLKGFKGNVSLAGSFGQDENKRLEMITPIDKLPCYKVTWKNPSKNWKETKRSFLKFKNAVKYYNSI